MDIVGLHSEHNTGNETTLDHNKKVFERRDYVQGRMSTLVIT